MKLVLFLFTTILTFDVFTQTYEEWFSLGKRYFDEAAYSKSVDAFTKAIELAPSFPDAYHHRGLVKIYLDQDKEGCADLKKALSLGYELSKDPLDQYCH